MSVIVTNVESRYYKKVKSKITFICVDGDKIVDALISFKKLMNSKMFMISKGYDMNGICVSNFEITWSLKKEKQ